jgi:hypothetical protein
MHVCVCARARVRGRIFPGCPDISSVRVRVTLRLTVSQPVWLGVVPHLGHMTRNLFFVLNLRKLQRSGLSFVIVSH